MNANLFPGHEYQEYLQGFNKLKYLLFVILLLCLSGCQAGYYLHLAKGHWQLMADRQPVDNVLTQDLPAEKIHKLVLSRDLLDFAEQHLALPVGDAYDSYVALDRDWVVWNLVAAPPFSLIPKEWCFPVAGCNSYRGYYDPERAGRKKDKLVSQGYEVYGNGAIAYSTLGWFADPLTTPMLAGDELWFAELLFHELVHRHFWLKGDTAFNESLATSVAREGVRRWLIARGDPDDYRRIEQRSENRQQIMALVMETRQSLETLYGQPLDKETMANEKARIIDDLREGYARAVMTNPSLSGWQGWFAGSLNNAQLATFNDYHQWIGAFDNLLLRCGGEWSCFWNAVESLAEEPTPERNTQLAALIQGHTNP